MPGKIPQTLVRELIRTNRLTQADADALVATATKEQKDIGSALIEAKIISDADLAKLKSELYRMPLIDLAKVEPDPDAFKEISEDVAGFYRVVPFSIADGILKTGVLDPEDINALEALKFIASDKGLKLEKYVISYKDFSATLKKFKSLSGEVGKALQSIADESRKGSKQNEPELDLSMITAESPVTKVVSAILNSGIDSRASDIHLEPFDDFTRARFRIDGVLQTVLKIPKTLQSAVVTRVKILSKLKIDETRVPQDGRFSIMQGKVKYDFRVSTFPTKAGEKVVMRILDPLSSRIDLAGLGIAGRSRELLQEAIERPYGIILITGPTGSGKSTTIAGMLKQMNTDEVNIVSLEDPIEYYIDGVNQSQAHEEIGYTFASGLRSILRQDPDVIMVGEIRDRETAGLAVQAALTGHVVLSTLHTNDAMGVIPRLVDMGVERYLIPPVLSLAVAQRLMRRLCETCKLRSEATAVEAEIIEGAFAGMPVEYVNTYRKPTYTLSRPNKKSACKECGGKAFKGRIGIYEMLKMTDDLEKIILGDLSESSLRAEATRQGMVTMFQDGIMKVLDGTCSLAELLEVAQGAKSDDELAPSLQE
ncbi:MAG: Flp pilus assembly complex ATPase component TadA [Candidatus Pacebacteria bacterium]|nr:Flp pilus assembly complex ATPase component TadA [Candidatus Paceibacterota bacterium]